MAIVLYIIIGIGFVATIATVARLLHEPEIPAYAAERKVVDMSRWRPLADGSIESNHTESPKLPKLTFKEVLSASGDPDAKKAPVESARH